MSMSCHEYPPNKKFEKYEKCNLLSTPDCSNGEKNLIFRNNC